MVFRIVWQNVMQMHQVNGSSDALGVSLHLKSCEKCKGLGRAINRVEVLIFFSVHSWLIIFVAARVSHRQSVKTSRILVWKRTLYTYISAREF